MYFNKVCRKIVFSFYTPLHIQKVACSFYNFSYHNYTFWFQKMIKIFIQNFKFVPSSYELSSNNFYTIPLTESNHEKTNSCKIF